MPGTAPITDESSTVATNEDLEKRSRSVNWYVAELKDIPETSREVFEEYSKIPVEKVADHVFQVVRPSAGLILCNAYRS